MMIETDEDLNLRALCHRRMWCGETPEKSFQNIWQKSFLDLNDVDVKNNDQISSPQLAFKSFQIKTGSEPEQVHLRWMQIRGSTLDLQTSDES